jgi:hypothetical protein
VALREENPQANDAELGEAAENTDTGDQCKKSQRATAAVRVTGSASRVRRPNGSIAPWEPRGAARQEIPGLPSDRTLWGANSEIKQLYDYMYTSIGSKLHEAII